MTTTLPEYSFLENKLKHLFKGITMLHGVIQKNLLFHLITFAITMSFAVYFSISSFFIAPYVIFSLVTIGLTIPLYLMSSSACDIEHNLGEIKEAFESSKQVLSDAKQLKSGKTVNKQSLMKNIDFIKQLTSLPGLTTDTAGNIASTIKLLTPFSAFLMVVSQAAMIIQFIIIIVTLLILIF